MGRGSWQKATHINNSGMRCSTHRIICIGGNLKQQTSWTCFGKGIFLWETRCNIFITQRPGWQHVHPKKENKLKWFLAKTLWVLQQGSQQHISMKPVYCRVRWVLSLQHGTTKVHFFADHYLYKFFRAIVCAHCARDTLKHANVEWGMTCTENKCLSLQWSPLMTW